MKVIRIVNKLEDVEVKTTDGQYCLTGQLTSDEHGVRAFDGGGVVRKEDGVEVACIDSWTRQGGLIVRFSPGHDVLDVSTVLKELTDAFTGTDGQPAAEEGGAA